MGDSAGRFTSRRDTVAFAACLVLAVGARLAPPGVQEPVASAIRGTVLAPFLALQSQAEQFKNARSRYDELVAERDSALVAAQAVSALQEENARLREILGLSRRLGVRHVGAEVLHQAAPTDGYTLILGAGREDGVQPMAPVLAPGGLVGVVRSVDRFTSSAAVWAHPDFRVSGMTADGSVFGIVAPRGGGRPGEMLLELRGVPYRQEVVPGTRIYTSGLGGAGGVYPRGIPVGHVLGIADEEAGWSRTYLVRPAVHPAAVSHVVVLTGRALDLREAFSEAP